jgi:hypothetical protein
MPKPKDRLPMGNPNREGHQKRTENYTWTDARDLRPMVFLSRPNETVEKKGGAGTRGLGVNVSS